MSTFKKADHMANQKGHKQVISKPSKSTFQKIGVSPPAKAPSPTPSDTSGIVPRKGGASKIK